MAVENYLMRLVNNVRSAFHVKKETGKSFGMQSIKKGKYKDLSRYQTPKVEKDFKKELKSITWGFYFLFFIIVVLFILFGLVMQKGYERFGDITYDTEINYHNLSEDEVKYIEEILSQVKPYMLERTKSLDFYGTQLPEKFGKELDIVGFNKARKIYLEFRWHHFKEDLCHEFLHNWIHEEVPAYDLERYDVCYMDENWFEPWTPED